LTIHQPVGIPDQVVPPGAMGDAMPRSVPDLFVDTDDGPVALTPFEIEAMNMVLAIDSFRDILICGVSLWAMMGGKPREPDRDDVFKPTESQLALRDGLWLEDDAGLALLATNPHPTIRLLVAQHEPTPAVVLDLLADDPWSEIRQAALGHTSLTAGTRERIAVDDPKSWLREEAAEQVPMVGGRCTRCGKRVKRPDRFLTCSIRCSVELTAERVHEGLYIRKGDLTRVGTWKPGFHWSAAVTTESGGIRGCGPGWGWIWFSFIPGLSAREVADALTVLVHTDGLDPEDAVTRLEDSHRATGR